MESAASPRDYRPAILKAIALLDRQRRGEEEEDASDCDGSNRGISYVSILKLAETLPIVDLNLLHRRCQRDLTRLIEARVVVQTGGRTIQDGEFRIDPASAEEEDDDIATDDFSSSSETSVVLQSESDDDEGGKKRGMRDLKRAKKRRRRRYDSDSDYKDSSDREESSSSCDEKSDSDDEDEELSESLVADPASLSIVMRKLDACRKKKLRLRSDVLAMRNASSEAEILNLTPEFKYEKYILTHRRSDFWREKVVLGIVEDLFDSSKPLLKMSLPSAAKMLGVSKQMMYSNFFKVVLPKDSRHVTLLEFLLLSENSEEKFWRQNHVEALLEMTRNLTVTVADGALQCGAAFKEFRGSVGMLREKAPSKRESAKMNPLEKKLLENDGANMSEYERARQKNIQNRLDFFKSLDFDFVKKAVKPPGKPTKPKEVLPIREKSSRIKAKEEAKKGRHDRNALEENADESAGSSEHHLPAINDIPLEELTSVDMDLLYSKRFLSCLNREIRVTASSGEKETRPIVQKMSAFVSSSVITSACIYPDSDLSLVVTGNVNGSLGIWFSSDPSFGRRCSFHPHTNRINQVQFGIGDRRKVLSCGDDGFLRVTDLEAQKVDLMWQWSHFYEDPEVKAVKFFVQRNASELVMVHEDLQAYLYDVRSPKSRTDLGHVGSYRLSVSRDDPNLLATLHDTSVFLLDLRYTGKDPISRIRGSNLSSVEFAPRGSNLLLLSSSRALVYKFPRGMEYPETNPVCLADVSTRALGACQTIWDPTRSNSLYSLLSIRSKAKWNLKFEPLCTIDSELGEAVDPVEAGVVAWSPNFGLEAEVVSSSLLVFNSDGPGKVVLYNQG